MSGLVSQGIWVVSAISLLVVAWTRFNNPPTNRAGTTFLLFHFGAVFYYALLIALWILVVILLKGGGLGLDELGGLISKGLNVDKQLSGSAPLIAAFIIVVASQFKRVRVIDTAARKFCIELAAIPKEAQRLAIELAHRSEFRIENSALRTAITREIADNIGENALNFQSDGSLSYRFTRAVSLYWLFVMPHHAATPLPFPTSAASRSAYAKVMLINDTLVEQCAAHYQNMMDVALAYFTSSKPTRQMEDAMRESVQTLSALVCNLIARFVLIRNKTSNGRRQRLSTMGFNAQDFLPAFSMNHWVTLILISIVMFLLMSLLIPSEDQRPFDAKLWRLISFAIQLGIAVFGGTIVAHRFLRRDEGGGTRFPPIAELTIAGLIVASLCIALRMGAPLIPAFLRTGTLALSESIKEFQDGRWSIIGLLFLCTFSIGLLCSYVANENRHWSINASLGALGNGITFLIGSLLFAFALNDRFLTTLQSDPDHARFLIVVTLSITGAVIGATVLAMFRLPSHQPSTIVPAKALPHIEQHEAAAGVDRYLVPSPLQSARSSVEAGGYDRSMVVDLEGRYVCFRPTFANPAIINAYIVNIRWNEQIALLVFEEENRHDKVHTQKGRIFIPQGKPFMSLVTIDGGAIRTIMVARPENDGLARGLITTLSNPGGVHYVPSSAPVALRRLTGEDPQLGFVHPGAPDYDLYMLQLQHISPDFAKFAMPLAMISQQANANPPKKPREAAQRLKAGANALKSQSKDREQKDGKQNARPTLVVAEGEPLTDAPVKQID